MKKKTSVLRKKTKRNTLKKTLELIQQGYSSETIAMERRLSLATIKGHFLKLYQEGEKIELSEFVTKKEVMQIKQAKTKMNNNKSLKAYYRFF